jgi:hypothetical protein
VESYIQMADYNNDDFDIASQDEKFIDLNSIPVSDALAEQMRLTNELNAVRAAREAKRAADLRRTGSSQQP